MYEKIVIVGCGPAGSSAATRLLEQDITKEVTILEKRKVIGFPPRCAGFINGSHAKAYGIEIPESVIVARIKKFVFNSPNESAVFDVDKLGYHGEYLTVDRTKFDQHLAEKARSLGAKIETSCEASRLRNHGLETWNNDTTAHATLGYDYLVAAAGFKEGDFSDIWDHTEKKDIAGCMQYVLRVPDYPQDTINLYFGKDITPGGYAWAFPGGNYDVRVGLGVPLTAPKNCGKYLDAFVEKMKWDLGTNLKECVGRLLPTTKILKTGLVEENVLLAGDQLHAVDPLTGGGILPAIRTGYAAADAILSGNVSCYDQLWRPILEDNNKRYRANKIFSMPDKKMDRLIKTLSKFSPSDVTAGTEVKQLLKFLARHDPLLLASLVKILL